MKKLLCFVTVLLAGLALVQSVYSDSKGTDKPIITGGEPGP